MKEALREERRSGDVLQHVREVAEEMLPRVPKQEKRVAFSEATKKILEQREETVKEGKVTEFEQLTKEFRRSKQRDRTNAMIETVNKDLDIRDKWLGIKQLKKEYSPDPYHRKETDGSHIPK